MLLDAASSAFVLQELATEYCIDPEIIFSLYRPLIRHIEPPAAPAPPEEEEEGEVAGASGKGGDASGGAVKPPGSGAAAANGPEPMEEEGEVVASPRGAAKAAVNLPAANGPSTEAPEVQQQRWEELERQVGCVAKSPVPVFLSYKLFCNDLCSLLAPHLAPPPLRPPSAAGARDARRRRRRPALARHVSRPVRHLLGAAAVRPGGAGGAVRVLRL